MLSKDWISHSLSISLSFPFKDTIAFNLSNRRKAFVSKEAECSMGPGHCPLNYKTLSFSMHLVLQNSDDYSIQNLTLSKVEENGLEYFLQKISKILSIFLQKQWSFMGSNLVCRDLQPSFLQPLQNIGGYYQKLLNIQQNCQKSDVL